MKPWHAIAAIVPAGLLMGLAAGHASRPVMQVQHERPWPQSVEEAALTVEPWRPIYEAGPEDLSPLAQSYRPDLDYDAYAWPDQGDGGAEMLAAVEYDYGLAGTPLEARYSEEALPQVHRSGAELAGDRAERAAQEALEVAAQPAPEPLMQATAAIPNVPAPVAPIETESF